MDVRNIGAGSVGGSEAANAARKAQSGGAAKRPAVAEETSDVVKTTDASRSVATLVAKAKATDGARVAVVEGYRELLGKGLFDTRAAAEKAAGAIVGG